MTRWDFKYRRSNNLRHYIERDDIRQQCTQYLTSFAKCMEEGREAVYGDESWVNANHTVQNSWQWSEFDRQGNFIGYKGSMNIKSGAGERLIINHFGSKNGFIPNGLELFVSQTNSGDYHREMNTEHYHEYVKDKLAPNLPDKCVVIIDRAVYHMAVTEGSKYPTKAWLKNDIVSWLSNKGVPLAEIESLTIPKLLELVKPLKPPQVYEVDDILSKVPHSSGAGLKDIKVLRLPVRHCFFNPIELVWAYVKGYVAKHNSSCKLAEVKRLTNEAITTIPADYWERCYNHSLKIMEEYKAAGNFCQQEVAPVIITNSDDDSDDSDDESSGGVTHEPKRQESMYMSDDSLEMDTDDEVDLDVDLQQSAAEDAERNAIAFMNYEAARKYGVSDSSESHCSCKEGSCTTNVCGCHKKKKQCSPSCKCSTEKCYNFPQPPIGFAARNIDAGQYQPSSAAAVHPLLPTSNPDAASFMQQNPQQPLHNIQGPTPARQKRKTPTYTGFCRCRKSNCKNLTCICRNSGNICNSRCLCSEYCINTDPNKIVVQRFGRGMSSSSRGPANNTATNLAQPQPQNQQPTLDVFGFDG